MRTGLYKRLSNEELVELYKAGESDAFEALLKNTEGLRATLAQRYLNIPGTCYGLGLGIDYILFFYEDRNFCSKKPYLWKITEEMKEEVRGKISRVNNYIAHREAPPADKDKCTYCRYKEACKRLERAQKDIHKNQKRAIKRKETEEMVECDITGEMCGNTSSSCAGCSIFDSWAIGDEW